MASSRMDPLTNALALFQDDGRRSAPRSGSAGGVKGAPKRSPAGPPPGAGARWDRAKAAPRPPAFGANILARVRSAAGGGARSPSGESRRPSAPAEHRRSRTTDVLHITGRLASAALICLSTRADAGVPTPLREQAAQLQSRLGDLAIIRAGLERKRDCFQADLSRYEGIRNANTSLVGGVSDRLGQLSAASSRLQAEVADFSAALQASQARLSAEAAKMDEIQSEGRRLAGELGKCRAVFFLTPDICNWGEQVAREHGSIRNISSETDRQSIPLDGARRALEESTGRLSASQSALARTTSDLASTRQDLDRVNATIADARKNTELLNITLASYKSGIELITSFVGRTQVKIKYLEEEDRANIDRDIDQIQSEQPSRARASEDPLPSDVRNACAR